MAQPTASQNITWHQQAVSKTDKHQLNKHRSCVLWFTGLSGSGKSTLANALAWKLHSMSIQTTVLDGDNIRHGLCKDLGFSDADRTENIRRIGEVSKLFVDAGTIVLTAFISPFAADRDLVRHLLQPGEFIEVFVDCGLETCEQRDPKGLYKKARAGEIKQFTGIDSPYELPNNPELVINTQAQSIEACVDTLIDYLQQKGMLS